ncbi:hypothetical protein [Dyadobacter sp. 50-39]|uniref:hypothetical protein n=1 Tax=Dyadobacter sp. 50-39 TaxID=1895756 RepID=UPI000B03BC3A|nr:hypothetical protein [Dyadobacter sp. 50-39]
MEPKRKILLDKIGEIPIDNSIPDVNNHPFFEKKRLDAIEFVKRTNLIEQLRERAPRD